jgi:hypothetical protein
MRLGLVTNARSERNKAGMAGLLQVIAGAPEIVHLAFDGSRSFGALLRELVDRGVTVVGINGGDGTAQGVLTALLEERPFAEIPPVAVLPRGMANTTGSDVGLKDRSPASLQRLITAIREDRLIPHLVARPVLRVENIKDWPPQRGMFFGAAGISEAIDICKQKVHALGFKGEASHALTLAGLLLVATTRGLDAAGLHGHEVGVGFDDGPIETRTRLLVLATTLEHLVLGSRPFWNTSLGPVHFTSVAYPPSGLLRHARQVLYGGKERALPSPAYESRGARKVSLDLAGSFTIDGQFFAPEPGRPLVLTADDSIRFVRI